MVRFIHKTMSNKWNLTKPSHRVSRHKQYGSWPISQCVTNQQFINHCLLNLIFNLNSPNTNAWTGTHFFFSAASKLVRLLDDSFATMVFHNIVLDISSEMFISGSVVTVILSTGMLMMLPLMRGTCTVPELSNTWDPWCA